MAGEKSTQLGGMNLSDIEGSEVNIGGNVDASQGESKGTKFRSTGEFNQEEVFGETWRSFDISLTKGDPEVEIRY